MICQTDNACRPANNYFAWTENVRRETNGQTFISSYRGSDLTSATITGSSDEFDIFD